VGREDGGNAPQQTPEETARELARIQAEAAARTGGVEGGLTQRDLSRLNQEFAEPDLRAARSGDGSSGLGQVVDAVRRGDMRTIMQLASAPFGIVGILLVLLGLLGACQPQPQQLGTIPGTTLSPATASPSGTPIAQVPSGSTTANVAFVKASGSCTSLASRFTDRYSLMSNAGAFTLTQLSNNHTTTGRVDANGAFSTTATDQSYRGTVSGTTGQGEHTYTGQGCNERYTFTMTLSSPLFAASGATRVPNRPPTAGGIIAVLSPPATTYTVQASDPEGEALRYTWTSTNNCGTFTGANSPTFVWSHPHPPCGDETVHPGTIRVQISDGGLAVLREYTNGSASGTGLVPPTPSVVAATATPISTPTASAPATSTTAASATAGSATTAGGGPNFPLVLGGLLLSGLGGGLYWAGRRSEPQLDPCAEQKRRVAAAKAAAAAARARKQRIEGLKAAADKAQADLQRAQREQAHATDDRHVSWGEDVESGRRVYTNKDQKARIDAANAALQAAQAAAASAKSAYEGAGNGTEAQQAQYAVEDADRELQRAEEALARCLQINAPAPPPTPPTPPPSAPTSTGGATTGGATTTTGSGTSTTGGTTTATGGPVVATPPPTVATTSGPKTQVRRECEDGAEPRVDVTERDFELYLIWAGKWQVDGAFQFSEEDVDDAIQNYKKFKTRDSPARERPASPASRRRCTC
jgi:hypothetical protein